MIEQGLALLQDGHWIVRVFVIVLIVVTVNLGVRLFLGRLQHRVRGSESIWDDAVYDAVNPPLRLFFWVLGLSVAAHAVEPLREDTIFAFIDPVRRVAIVGLLIWFLVRLIANIEQSLLSSGNLRGEPVDRTTVEALAKLIRLSVLITGMLVILQTLGFSISGVLAFGGIGGLAISFAAKDMLSNLFGGLTVYMDRPFAVGDWVRSPDKDIEGTVEKIGWRTTRIRRFNKRPIYVPNSLFTSVVVENPSRMSNRRIHETIGLRYADADKINSIVEGVRAMLRAHDEIDQDQTIIVNFDQFGASSMDFFIYCLTRTTNWVHYHQVKHQILMQVHAIIIANGAEIAFPSRSLYMESTDEPEGVEA